MHSKLQDNSALFEEKRQLYAECLKLLSKITDLPLANKHLRTAKSCMQLCLSYKANRRTGSS